MSRSPGEFISDPQSWQSGTGQGPFTVDAGGTSETNWDPMYAMSNPSNVGTVINNQPSRTRPWTTPLAIPTHTSHSDLPILRNPSAPDLSHLSIRSPTLSSSVPSASTVTTSRSGRRSRQGSHTSTTHPLSSLSSSPEKPYGRPPVRSLTALDSLNAHAPWLLPSTLQTLGKYEGPPPSAGLSPYLGPTSTLPASLDPSGSLSLDLDPVDLTGPGTQPLAEGEVTFNEEFWKSLVALDGTSVVPPTTVPSTGKSTVKLSSSKLWKSWVKVRRQSPEVEERGVELWVIHQRKIRKLKCKLLPLYI